MGKNKKQTKNPKKKQEQKPNEVSIGTDASDQTQETQELTQEEIQQQQMTAEEKAQQYKQIQLTFFNNCVKDFQDEEATLKKEPDFTDKEQDIEKRARDEMKRFEKVSKKERNEIEDLYQNPSIKGDAKVKALRDRIAKSIQEIQKRQELDQKYKTIQTESERILGTFQKELSGAAGKRQLLQNLCLSLLDKNYELYLKHEKMLEQEREERTKLAANFGEQMKEVTSELEDSKSKRSAEFQENQDLRTKIQNVIKDYKKKEEQYRGKMETHSKVIQDVEKKLKSAIEGSITRTLKQAEKEKAKFIKSCENVKDLSEKINGYAEKFDKIKEEMGSNGKRFETFQSEIETKNLKLKLLDTEIQNIALSQAKQQKVQAEIEDEKKRMLQQIETLRSLKNALDIQNKGLSDQSSNKENQLGNQV